MFCTYILCSQQGQLLRFHFLMPCLKLLSDVDCLKFSRTNAQILAPKVDIDSMSKLLVQLYLRSRTWPLLRLWAALSQNLKISAIIVGDIPVSTLKISVAKYWRFLECIVTDLSFSSNWWKVELLSLYIMHRALSCNLLSLLLTGIWKGEGWETRQIYRF